ncbi:tRNA pseudouridine(55) synthase TruB [Microbacterium protaetiae]|uniref:tRNA pseudouridine synthase B n=1 Tax=Microbacterium protaetiae TaxID=2509458 RepID=A0A4P6EHQ4_9MICO|nr:tRNA pseudouridine(55) synthase TruB [Microbacterium protaetiae]QAY60749.1 tRNA pseudouridine(55) synthase TruB [Microbacterium protaetiae]
MAAHSGILLVDKPGGITSHDVVGRARKALNTRKIGHAGTLDPMATGLLILGIGPATRLLTYLVGLDKTYMATIRLGQSTDSDDADSEITARAPVAAVAAVTSERLSAALARLTGPISQVPSRVSAIKVGGRRAYDLAREGTEVALAARDVVVSRFDVLAMRESEGCRDLDVVVDCSSGTYVRALARDLGADLGVGGHLTALRRTRVGPFDVADAASVDAIATARLLSPAGTAAQIMPVVHADADQARDLRHGKRVAGLEVTGAHAAAIDGDGALIGIVQRRGDEIKSVMNMPEEQRE